jgi:hypothetical protein
MAYRVPDRPVAELTARWAPPPSQFVPVDGMLIHLPAGSQTVDYSEAF